MPQMLELIKLVTCPKHTQCDIVQICVSSSCNQVNRLCCLQCVDESHCGQTHILISSKKFGNLMEQFHVILDQKSNMNQNIIKFVDQKTSQFIDRISTFGKKINSYLKQENQTKSYQEVNNLDVNKLEQQQIRGKLNELVLNHGWMLEINIQKQNIGSSQQIQSQEEILKQVRKIVQQKYDKLQLQIRQILDETDKQIEAVFQKQQCKLKKLFHLFEEIKYKIRENGDILFVKHNSKQCKHNEKTVIHSLLKSQQNGSQKKQKSYADYLNDLCD